MPTTTKKTATKAVKKTAKKAAKKVAKKASKKSVAMTRKSVAKKPARKGTVKSKKMALMCADGASCFWVKDGPILKDLEELHKAMEGMSDDLYAYHVSAARNDFADWVEFVLSDQTMATALRKTKKRAAAITAIAKRLQSYDF